MNRHITLMYRDGTKKDIKKIKDWCKANSIEFNYRYSRDFSMSEYIDEEGEEYPLYYFTIFSDTAHFEELRTLMGENLLTTDFAEFSNSVDCDDKFERTFKEIIDKMYKNRCEQTQIDSNFLHFIMPIKDVKTLEAMQKYIGFMSSHQQKILSDRIEIVKGNKKDVQDEFVYNMSSLGNDVKALREKTKMTRREFCSYFDIPYRTVEDWENKKSTCATYLYKLMEEKIINDGLISGIRVLD